MSEVRKPIMLDETGQDIVTELQGIKNALTPTPAVLYTPQNLTEEQKIIARNNIGAATYTPMSPNFKEMQTIIRAGHGSTMYPVGSIFHVPYVPQGGGKTITIPFQVLAHTRNIPGQDEDIYKDPDGILEYSMIVASVYSIGSGQYDSPEAFYNTGESGMIAGNYRWRDNSTYRYFTLTQNLPANRQLVKASESTIYVYNPSLPNSAQELEISMSTTAIADYIDLGQTGAKTGANAYKVNEANRITYGSNNYEQSGIRQYLNSDAIQGQWWEAKTPFDRPPSDLSTKNGFLNGLYPEFVDIIGYTDIRTRLNTTFELPDSAPSVKDRIFLLSTTEVKLASYYPEDGKTLDYYSDAVNVDRVKYNLTGTSTTTYWWLRSPTTSSAYNGCIVDTSGALNINKLVSFSYGVVPACVIR